jgi:hypothetical protein
MQGAVRRQGRSLAKRRNAADTPYRGNPEGRAHSGASLCRVPLAMNDIAARPASRAASRIRLAAGAKSASAGPEIMQEVIALSVFIPFAVLYMKVELKWDFLWASLCLIGAVYFMFRSH